MNIDGDQLGEKQRPVSAAFKSASMRKMDITDHTLDAFHDGSFFLYQPKNGSYRSGMDALLVAAFLPENATGRLADLGAGTGAAGMAAISLNQKLELTSVEREPHLISCLQESFALVQNQQFAQRVNYLECDIVQNSQQRKAAGLVENDFDHVIFNPPYNDKKYRAPQPKARESALMLGEGGLDAWFRAATSITKPGGNMVMIHRAENIANVLSCCIGRFGNLQIIPIHSRKDEPAKRILVRGVRASNAPLQIMPDLIIHEDDGSFTKDADAIFRGKERLY